ncbi:hypothetical protein [Streptomyces sp. NRRL S-87]|uniref:hypothetical protein n=1 Tax=Streptomyces sp. NRRL S-87 TaxID=1463920 RepID=UPI0004C0EE6C|nr:hypothetical protein [Streptomyces sp. NRRL S-87]
MTGPGETARGAAGARRGADGRAGTFGPGADAGVNAPVNAPVNTGTRRRAAVDPVKVLMHRHRDLCERAVDPLEIAAGLEAHGVTDRTAARFRHRDVFSLAEELYARVPRGEGGPAAAGAGARGTGARGTGAAGASYADADPAAAAAAADRTGGLPGAPGPAGLAGLPGRSWSDAPVRRRALVYGTALAAGAATLATRALATRAVAGGHVHGPTLATTGTSFSTTGTVVSAVGTTVVVAALAACLRLGPLRARGRGGAGVWLWALALVAAVAAAQGLFGAVPADAAGSAAEPAPAVAGPAAGTLAALVPAALPATWCAAVFSGRARRRLAASRVLAEFAAGVRPLLLGVCALFAAALAGLLALTGAPLAAGTALGTLLFLARLLAAHGAAAAARTALGVACAAQGLLLGAAALGQPVPEGATTALCAAALLALLGRAATTLSRASAHIHT